MPIASHSVIATQATLSDPGAYEHVLVVMSIVIGLAVTQLLKGVAQLYRTRAKVRTYWLHWAWTILLVVFSLVVWWTYWSYRSITDWTFLRFLLYLSPAVAFYLLTAIAFPAPDEGVVDLKAYYFANRGGFFGAFALYAVLAGITAMFVRGMPVTDVSNLFRLGMVALTLVAMRSSNARVHAVIFSMAAILLLGFVAFFQFRLA